jgi:predicted DNA-binding antitoxin AbrB/MazE fold protein|tara:strand:- start:393 stop:581 length:189 start_codon:yes stop_codon:yes gene_type:complete
MDKKIQVTYKNGVLIPKDPLNLDENIEVEIIINASSPKFFADEKLLAENWLSEEDNEAWKDL